MDWHKKVPSTITIGYLTYKVKIMPVEDDEEDYDGLHMNHAQIIKVKGSQTEPAAKDTIIHECLHAIAAMFELKNKSTEEEWCSRGAHGLIMLAQQNPELWAWIGTPTGK